MSYRLMSRIATTAVALSTIISVGIRAEEQERIVIENGRSVSVEYTLKLDDGTTVDTNVGEDPLTYQHGNDELLPALEEALLGQAVGDSKEIKLTAEEGYGAINPDAYQEVPLDSIPEDSRAVGTMLVATTPEGQQQPIRVHEIKEETAVLDFNHPLAGQALNFDVTVIAVE